MSHFIFLCLQQDLVKRLVYAMAIPSVSGDDGLQRDIQAAIICNTGTSSISVCARVRNQNHTCRKKEAITKGMSLVVACANLCTVCDQ